MTKKSFFLKKDLDNQLDFFKTLKKQHVTNPKTWILKSCVIIFLLSLTLLKIRQKQKTQLLNLQQENKTLLAKKIALHKQIQEMEYIEKQNKCLAAKIEKIKAFRTKSKNPSELLLAITQNLPDTCWLTRIILDSQKSEHKTSKIIELEGLSMHQKDITVLTQNLKDNPLIKNVKITNITKCKDNAECNAQYSFKIAAKHT
jgi:Tfp pilus assembly protein PilN